MNKILQTASIVRILPLAIALTIVGCGGYGFNLGLTGNVQDQNGNAVTNTYTACFDYQSDDPAAGNSPAETCFEANVQNGVFTANPQVEFCYDCMIQGAQLYLKGAGTGGVDVIGQMDFSKSTPLGQIGQQRSGSLAFNFVVDASQIPVPVAVPDAGPPSSPDAGPTSSPTSSPTPVPTSIPDAGPGTAPTGPPICGFPGGGDAGPVTATNGVVGQLTYVPPQYAPSSIAQFEPGAPNVVMENSPIYLSSIDVPDQNFTQGFTTSNGTLLTDDQGNVLTQFFALFLKSNLMIQAGDTANPPGLYQLGVISDDGSNVIIGGNGSASLVLINNDGEHANTLGCATQGLTLAANTQIPIQVQYFQGPPVSLALMLLWRPVSPQSGAQAFSDPNCGVQEGDGYYSAGSNGLAGLQSRGWQVIPPQYYYLDSGTTNPCNNP